MRVKIKQMISGLTLSQRFMLASLVILVAGMVGIGVWIERQIKIGVMHRTGVTTALYVDSFVAPNLQELGYAPDLSPEHVEKLGTLLQNTPLGRQIVAFRVWDTRGRLLYSTDPASSIGKTFPMHEGLLVARLGMVSSGISSLNDEENARLGTTYAHLLETYSPVWLSGTDQVIAVAEFYQKTDELDREIGILKQRSWLVVSMAIFLMYLLLSGFVRNASDIITRQQTALGGQVKQLTDLLVQNRALHERIRRASASVALLNESNLRRIGSELHDGPTQDLGLSLLKLDAQIGRLEANSGEQADQVLLDQLSNIQASLQNALKELRGIASGLSLPQLAELSLPETIIRVVRAHERQSGSQVTLEMESVPEEVAMPIKITTYRFIQEALNNAFRHAGGVNQQVRVHRDQDRLVLEVSDRGPGFDPEQINAWDGHLGVSGMRERVESIGGEFNLQSTIGQGTIMQAYVPVQ